MSFYKLLELAYGLPVLSEEEWKKKLIGQKNQKRLGLRSPKLSKFLLARGVPEKVLQKAMAVKNKGSYFSTRWEEQGDSIHYSSCQALNTKAKWFERHEKSLWQEGDATASEKGWVHLWVVGRPMSENGEGFLTRAKVRMVYDKKGALQGAFVDRIYGQQELLDIEELKVLLFEKYGKEVPVLRLGGNIKGEVPSSKLGYQDTFKLKEKEYSFSSLKGPLLEALQERLATPLWLRQEYREVLEGKPPKSTKPRPSKKELGFPKKVKAFLGLPKSFRITKVEEKGEEVYWDMSGYTLCGSKKGWVFQHYNGGWIHKKPNGLFVGDDIPELGFYKPRRIKRKQ